MRFPSYTLQALGIASILPHAQSSPTQRPFNVGQEVSTTSGIIHGHAAANRTEVSEYLGIPFAQPPLGDLRFAAPKRFRSKAHFNASSFGPACLTSVTQANYSILTDDGYHLAPTAEEYFNVIHEHGIALGEDCLTLNVWTKPQVGEKAKAVLFFIYGGGFQGGFTSDPFTTGQFLADEQDVVIISANYRVNVFGFPGLQPEVAGVAPNAGLLDQRLAIEWARDNVGAFGGDPSRITLFGQSAGSASISMYGFAYASDPIVHGLITQSGTADGFGVAPPNSTAAWQSLSGLLGCGNVTSSAESLSRSVACVRSKPAAAVQNARLQVPMMGSALGAFAPSADGRTAFANYSTLTTAGRFAQIPRLLGSNAQEGGSFQLEFAWQGLNLPTVFWEWYTLVFFTCPTSTAAVDFARTAPTQPVWRYIFHGDYPNTQLTVNPSVGAFHGSELSQLFATSPMLGIPDSPAEAATGRLMRSAWAAFAKDPHAALTKPPFRWPALPSSRTAAAQTVLLGLGNATSAVFKPSAAGDASCPMVMPAFEAIGGPIGLLTLAAGAGEALQGIQDGDVAAVAQALLRLAGVGVSGR
ncbi:alpha/beta-hydrolase [Lindgomyces ingoldianus]|uniref:Alpha/beta-hydrolase n=1 Tax=Lindgomyces ingoldianus TaxID=673940 RepID=A0ACB6QCH2_9PLEO|nr:alpha/beta-hydrolase [Lindgomyces ingoldianus]KAF2464550.1 alpha/beta-hydrolase [Lindgomyces ingoldianus]